jgi:hypothetical protein
MPMIGESLGHRMQGHIFEKLNVKLEVPLLLLRGFDSGLRLPDATMLVYSTGEICT